MPLVQRNARSARSIGMVLVLFWTAWAPTHAAPEAGVNAATVAVPDEAAVAEALKLARDLYQADYAAAATPAAKSALAKKILDQGVATQNDPVSRYVLLRLARDIATHARDVNLAFSAIEQMASSFSVDALDLKAAVVNSAAESMKQPNEAKALTPWLLSLARDASEAEKHDLARQLAKLAQTVAAKTRDRELAQQARARASELEAAAEAYTVVAAARDVLRQRPDDADANTIVGKYLCFERNDWTAGLPQLAKGTDSVLKPLAERELNRPPQDTATKLALGDAWWDAAQKAQGKSKESMLLHAGGWYQRADLPNSTTLLRAKVESRLAEIAKLGRKSPGPAGRQSPPLAIAPFDERTAKEHQRRWAEYLGVPVQMANSIGMKVVLIPPGYFNMGSTDAEVQWFQADAQRHNDTQALERIPSESPQHRVRISQAYYLGMFEVTQDEFKRVMGTNPSVFAASGREAARVAGRDTSRFPVDSVTWDEAVQFCARLSSLPAERAAHRTYRLPTEAEWEYACRAGTTAKWYFGDDDSSLGRHAWFVRNTNGTPHPVGEKEPTVWGLYDMQGNIREWCHDWFDLGYYGQSPLTDPGGPSIGSERATRGENFVVGSTWCRPAYRNHNLPDTRARGIGFRIVATDGRQVAK